MNSLSAKNRPQLIEALQNETFDLIVIGGGITGAGVALDAASRGLKTALVEKDDFGAGTSSKSTKLIHGGLRYLKQLEINLVKEVGRERAIVHRLAPHLVVPEKMLLPLVKGGTYGPMATRAGLWVYDVLAGVSGNDKRQMLNRDETLNKEPLLSPEGLLGGGYYAEYRTDDARLTIENIKAAANYGALCINYMKADDFIYRDDKITGLNCTNQLNGHKIQISGSQVISAAGPWVDTLRKKDQSLSGKHLFLSKGVHIVLPHEKLPLQQSIYFDNDDGRMIFAIPRHRVTYIGTTDTPYEGDLNNIPINLEDVEYLLAATNQMFPDIHLEVKDVESSWAGLRPLIHEEGKSASEMSRKDEIFESESGLVSIAGGKLTGYRKMAERVVDVIVNKLPEGKKLKKNHTQKIPLANGQLKDQKAVNDYKQELRQRVGSFGLEPYYAAYLVANYGKQSDQIVEQIAMESNYSPEEALLVAELAFTMENEMVNTALDFFNRRTGRLYFNLPSILPNLSLVLDRMGEVLDWDTSRRKEEENAVKSAIAWISEFQQKQQITS